MAFPDVWRGVVDDAAVFPPGDAPLPEAVTAYVERDGAWWSDLVGSFVVTDVAIPDIAASVPVSVVVTGGAGAIAGALRLAGKSEVTADRPGDRAARPRRPRRQRPPGGGRGRRRPVRGAARRRRARVRRAATDRREPRLARGRRRGGRGRAAAEVPHRRARGRPVPHVRDAGRLDRRGAGPRDAVQVHGRPAPRRRPPRPRDRLRHHGFLNVLLATRQAFDGASTAEVATLLSDHYPNDLVALARSATANWPARAGGSRPSGAATSASRSMTWSASA